MIRLLHTITKDVLVEDERGSAWRWDGGLQPQQLPEAKELSEVHLISKWLLQTKTATVRRGRRLQLQEALADQAHVKERNVVVPQFDVAFTQKHRMRRDGCGPHADVISQSGLLRHAI